METGRLQEEKIEDNSFFYPFFYQQYIIRFLCMKKEKGDYN